MSNSKMIELSEFFRDKKVLVTGHTGFKGSWLILWLHVLGAKVTGVALEPEEKSLFNQASCGEFCDSKILDVRNTQAIGKVVNELTPDVVFHLAAQPLVRYSYEHPIETYETNVIGTANVMLHCAKLKNRCSVVSVTTDKVYENREWHYPYRECDALGGYDPYSSSKACAEIVTASFRRSFCENEEVGIATARAGNVIGGGDWAVDRIVPDIARAIGDGNPVQVRNPAAIRPWQLVLESLYGYLLLGMKLYENPRQYADAWNFGPDSSDRISVKELVEIAIDQWGSGAFECPELQQPHEAKLLMLDNSKAVRELGWKPTYDSSTAIRKTIDWYCRFQQNSSISRELCIEQIEEFTSA